MPRLSYGKRNAIRQALELQKLCYSGAQLLSADLQASADKEARARVATALGHLLRNWSCLQESVRILAGRPLPGSLRPEDPTKTRRRRWSGNATIQTPVWIDPSSPDSPSPQNGG